MVGGGGGGRVSILIPVVGGWTSLCLGNKMRRNPTRFGVAGEAWYLAPAACYATSRYSTLPPATWYQYMLLLTAAVPRYDTCSSCEH